jgi:cytochrome c
MIGHSAIRTALLAAAAGLLATAPAMAQDEAAEFGSACGFCHSVEKPAHNKVGPSLLGVVGRKAGTLPGFGFSTAMKAYGKAWQPANLDAFIAAPSKVVPGTTMASLGVKDPAKRARLIAYLQKQK